MKKAILILVMGFLWCGNVTSTEHVADWGCVGKCWNGEGTWKHRNGDIYVGEFKDGKRHGQGTYTYANGSVDEGKWKKGKLVKRKKLSKKEKAAAKDEPGHVYYKDEKLIHVKFSWGSTAERVAIAHCSSLGKFAFQFYGDGLEYSGNSARIYHCSRSNLSKSPTSGGKFLWTNYDENHEFAQKGQEDKKFDKIEGYKKTCSALGFEFGTDKFADCTLKLFVADNKETTKIVQSSSGAQEIIIRDPDRERRIGTKAFSDFVNGKCQINLLSKNPCQF